MCAFVTPGVFLPARGRRCSISARRPVVSLAQGADYYRQTEGVEENGSEEMQAWNDVIYKSLRRKLSGTEQKSPAVAGVSSVVRPIPDASCAVVSLSAAAAPATHLTPTDVVQAVLRGLEKDVHEGARVAISFASDSNKVRFTTPEHFVLFVGDSALYKDLLHIRDFQLACPVYSPDASLCTVSTTVTSTSMQTVKYGFQLSKDRDGRWMIDELFKLELNL